VSQSREEKEAAAKARMAELAVKFVDRTAGELESLRGFLGRLNTGDVQVLDDIRNVAHRMCGTGATLGFETLADCAYRVEQLSTSNGAVPDSSTVLQLGTAVDALEVELGRLKGK
jgi:HPt (histidine-containing phosphotransfer) domain-containing protein